MSLKTGEIEKLIGSKKLPEISISKHKLWDTPSDPSPENNESKSAQIIEIDPNDIVKWEHKDRPSNELGDLEELAKTLSKTHEYF